jgi:hypothetical protein
MNLPKGNVCNILIYVYKNRLKKYVVKFISGYILINYIQVSG